MRFTSHKVLLLAGALALTASPAWAEPAAGGEHSEASHSEGGEHGGEHGDEAHGEDGHGEGHGGGHHGLDPWADDNGNGTANFLDGNDEHYAGSQSLLAAMGLDGGIPVYAQWGFHLLNLLILIGILAFAARKPIAAMLRDRALTIKSELDESAALESDARSRHEELESRLSGFEAEVAEMKAAAQRSAASEKSDIEQRATDAAQRIAASAQRAIRDETARATKELRSEAVDLAVKLAEETLRNQLGVADRQRLANELLTSLGSTGGKHG